jgi:hypothetical protein
MLAAPDKHSHIEMISALAELFSSDEDMNKLHQATNIEEIKTIIALLIQFYYPAYNPLRACVMWTYSTQKGDNNENYGNLRLWPGQQFYG